ncbi:MAG TPA: hypothetical protein PKC32_02825 [Sphingopyxis sp.]|nr:hypothetical protein [Sphingopyxis sp.]
MTTLAVLLSLLLVPAACAKAVTGQLECDVPAANEWLLNPPDAEQSEAGPAEPVFPVQKNIAGAIELLDSRSIVRLTAEQLVDFGIETDKAASPTERSAFLVRAVYPTRRPTLNVGWVGNDLHVFAGGLGCAPFTKHPLVVFLDHEPERVFVMASAAL